MKKLIIVTALLTLSSFTQASNGSKTQLSLKNSMAGFASESIEKSTRLLYRLSPQVKNNITGAKVDLLTNTDSIVQIEHLDGTTTTFSCFRFDDWSKGGTVLKKEVVCRK
jgi:hypothetical protein